MTEQIIERFKSAAKYYLGQAREWQTASKLRAASYLLIGICFTLSATSQTVFALSASQKQLFDTGTNWFNEQAAGDCNASGATSLTGSDNMEKAYNYFTGQGLTGAQAAGIIGNMWIESKLEPTVIQGGQHSNTVPSGNVGYGIVQWTPAHKLTDIIKEANISGNPSDLGTQLDALWAQLKGTAKSYAETGALADLKKQKSPYDAAVSFLTKYERAADSSPTGPNAHARGGEAQQVYNLYGAGAGGSDSSSGGGCGGGNSAVDCQDNSNDSLSEVRQKVVCEAQAELKDWTPLPSKPRMGYTKYTDGAQEEWCADFVSWLYKQAGDPFTGGASGGWRIAAVSGIVQLGQKGGNFHYHTSHYTPKPGDMAIHGNHSHVNLVVSVSGQTVAMIGGDQGSGPYGGPDNGAIVSKDIVHGYFGGDITGYVSPD